MAEQLPLLLYAEDEAMVAMAVSLALEEAGFVVELAHNGAEAIQALEAGPTKFRALITDIRMPGADGWAVARRARELNPTIPVVYASGDSAGEWPVQGVPNSLMLQKPFANAQIVTAVSSLLNAAPVLDAGNTQQ